MRIKNFLPAFAACVLLAFAAVSASAQVGRIEGDIKKRGSGEPIVGAVVEIVRQDIKGNYGPLKTDKKGHYLHAGVPYVGTYTVLVSAEGYAPSFATGIRPDKEPVNFELDPGDGKKLTMDDIKKAQASAPTQAGAAAAKQPNPAEVKKQQEEIEKAKAANEKSKADFENMKKRFEAGRLLADKKDYAGAITEFNEAIKLDADQHVIHANLALALFNRGATQLNAGQRDPAKQDFSDSVAAATKAVSLVDALVNDPAKASEAPNNKKTKGQYLKIKADSEGVLATRFGDAAAADAAATDYKAAAELSDDPAVKKALHVKLAKTFFDAGKSAEAVAAYQEILQTDPDNLDALYNLGLAYAGASKFQESADTLQKFLDKAPASDQRVPEVKTVIKDLVVGNNLTPPKADTGGRSSTAKGRKKP